MQNLNDLFENTLKDIYFAEKAITKALPKMAKKAVSEDLAEAFKTHAGETEGQVERLEQVFELIGKSPRGKRCPAIEGLIEEATEVMNEAKDPAVCDAAMVAAAQAIEHYEIARYGSLVAWAEKLGQDKAVQLLSETLEEEKATDDKLNGLAESEINLEASGEADKDADDENEEDGTSRRRSESRGVPRDEFGRSM